MFLEWHDPGTRNYPGGDGGSAITSYKIEAFSRYDRTGPGWYVLAYVPKNGTETDHTFTLRDLVPNTTFQFRVSAINADGVSEPSNESYETSTRLNGAYPAPALIEPDILSDPAVYPVTVDWDKIELTFTETLADSIPSPTQFDVHVDGLSEALVVSSVDVTDAKVTLTLAETDRVYHDEIVHVSYYPSTRTTGDEGFSVPTYNNSLQDADGNIIDVLISQPAQNLTPDTRGTRLASAPTSPSTPASPPKLTPDPPQYLRATPGNAQVTLTWDAPFYDTGDITGYAYRYKESDETFGYEASADWSDIPGGVSVRSYTATGLTNGTEYKFEVRAENAHGGGTSANATITLPESSRERGGAASVNTESEEIPTQLTLMGNYPNPFNPETVIDYVLPQTSHVRLAVYDMIGKTVAVLIDGNQPQGQYTARFNADGLPTGTYVYRLTAGAETLTRTMTLVR